MTHDQPPPASAAPASTANAVASAAFAVPGDPSGPLAPRCTTDPYALAGRIATAAFAPPPAAGDQPAQPAAPRARRAKGRKVRGRLVLRWLLADVAGEHYLTPDGWFLPVAAGPYRAGEVVNYASRPHAEATARLLRTHGCHVRPVRAHCEFPARRAPRPE